MEGGSARRWWWIGAGSVTAVAAGLVIGLVVIVPGWTGRPFGGVMVDRGHRVRIVIPQGWSDVTADEAGRVVTDDGYGDAIAPVRLPDLAATSDPLGDSAVGSRSVTVDVLPADRASLAHLHDQHVASACEQVSIRCADRRPSQPTVVDHHPAIVQFLTPRGSTNTVLTVTVASGDRVIRFTGVSQNWVDAEDGGPLTAVSSTIRVIS